MNILKPDQVKHLEESFFDKVSGTEHDKAIMCIMLLKLQGYKSHAPIEVKLDLLAALHALAELLDIKRILSPTPGEDSAVSDEDLLKQIREYEETN